MTAQAFYRGQAYQRLRSEPYVRRDGIKTTILIWKSNCMTCGAEFECTTSSDPAKFKPARNCLAHRHARSWTNRVKVTDPASIGPLPDGRPITPIEAYDGGAK